MDEPTKDYILAWLRKADHDLKTARIIIGADDEDKPFDVACFHCQQAAEKYLKAYLIFLGLAFPRTHNIAQLIEIGAASDQKLREYLVADELTAYGVDVRYPDDPYMPMATEAQEAMLHALSLRIYIEQMMQSIL